MRAAFLVAAAVALAAPPVRAAGQPPPALEPDLLPPPKPRTAGEEAQAKELARALRTRRRLLELHQGVGYALLGGMAATVVLGQLNYADKYGGGGDTGRFQTAHHVAAYGTAGLFAAAGVLALVAPAPFERSARLDTATLHRIAMATATAGMVAQIALGIAAAHSEGSLRQRDYALAHQIVGYTTFAATSAGFLVLWF